MPAPDCLDDVVREICSGRDKDVDVAVPDEISNDPAHPRRYHRAGKAEEFGCVIILQHLRVDLCRLAERAAVVRPGFSHSSHQFANRHGRLICIWVTGLSHWFFIAHSLTVCCNPIRA